MENNNFLISEKNNNTKQKRDKDGWGKNVKVISFSLPRTTYIRYVQMRKTGQIKYGIMSHVIAAMLDRYMDFLAEQACDRKLQAEGLTSAEREALINTDFSKLKVHQDTNANTDIEAEPEVDADA
ncbi:MAG: hypothetical protein QXS03_01470 [Candidatus Micrarchaeaceae archaeon]